MSEEKTISFIENLSKKFRKENDLSDITWALAEASQEFKILFLSFFWDDINDSTIILNFEREYSESNKRPDFYIETRTEKYLIEVKINDRNHHFESFLKKFPDYKYGYITNYSLLNFPISYRERFVIKTWEEFAYYLESQLKSDKISGDSKAMVEGYSKFIISVCSIFKLKKMNVESLSSLFHFNKLIQKIIGKPVADLEVSINNKPKNFNEDKSGYSFELKKKNSEIVFYPWFGIYYNEDPAKTTICIRFNQIDSEPVYNFVQSKPEEGAYYVKPFIEDEAWFELKQNHFEMFNKEASVEKQEELLTNFYNEVVLVAARFL